MALIGDAAASSEPDRRHADLTYTPFRFYRDIEQFVRYKPTGVAATVCYFAYSAASRSLTGVTCVDHCALLVTSPADRFIVVSNFQIILTFVLRLIQQFSQILFRVVFVAFR